jgi:hypothetical protein
MGPCPCRSPPTGLPPLPDRNGYPLLLVSFPEKDIISGQGSGGKLKHWLEAIEPFLWTWGAVPSRRWSTLAWEWLSDAGWPIRAAHRGRSLPEESRILDPWEPNAPTTPRAADPLAHGGQQTDPRRDPPVAPHGALPQAGPQGLGPLAGVGVGLNRWPALATLPQLIPHDGWGRGVFRATPASDGSRAHPENYFKECQNNRRNPHYLLIGDL